MASPITSTDIEELLRTAARRRKRTVTGPPIVVACLTAALIAPGCAAAAAFLMRVDAKLPPLAAASDPVVAKADRLPLGERREEAEERIGMKDDARLDALEPIVATIALDPLLMRGSLEDSPDTVSVALDDAAVVAVPLPDAKPRLKRALRRSRPVRLVVELQPDPPPQPTFLERLFGRPL